jgi:hypothetical protein
MVYLLKGADLLGDELLPGPLGDLKRGQRGLEYAVIHLHDGQVHEIGLPLGLL